MAGLVAVFAGAGSAQAERPAPGSITPERLKLPSGPSSVRGLADEPAVEPFGAQLSYQVPIELPAGQGGLTPTLALVYSGALGNGPIGIGWTLAQPKIQRSTRLGVPKFDDSDDLEISGIASGRLVSIGSGEYRVEGMGQTVRVRRVDAGFEVDDGTGVHYRLGTSPASRQEGDPTHTLAWLVERQTNLMGEQIQYDYSHDQNQVYLTGMTWGPGGVYHVTLGYETRADPHRSYRGGFSVMTAQRLARVTITAFGIERRAYHLTYQPTSGQSGQSGLAFPLSRLGHVTSTGVAGADAWPELTFTYAAPAAAAIAQIAGIGSWRLNADGVTLADLDGDGAADLLKVSASGHSYLTNQNGTFGGLQSLTGNALPLDAVQLQDIDGDARPELLQDTGNGWAVWKFSKTRWTQQPGGVWPGSVGLALKRPSTTRFADLNGDGLVDAIQWSNDNLSIRLATRTGLSVATVAPRIGGVVIPTEDGRFHDTNGDGLDDYVLAALDHLDVYLGHGDGRFDASTRVPYPFHGTVDHPGTELELADLDRDGLMDLLKIESGTVRWFRGLANGTFTADELTLANPEPLSNNVVVAVVDSNGNGSHDVVWSSPSGMWRMDLAGPTTAGMLVNVQNGLGMDVTFAYESSHTLSAAARLAGGAWTSEVPIAMPVPVSKTTVLGPGETTRLVSYGVRDGFWDAVEQRFGGFLTTTVTTAGATPAETSTINTRYLRGTLSDRELRGKPQIVQVSDGTGKRLSFTTNGWQAMVVAGLPDAPLLRRAVLRTVHTQYDDTSPVRHTDMAYDYDALGRLRHTVNSGRSDIDGDESVRDLRYADDDTTWVRDQLCEEKVFSTAGTLFSHVQHLFGDADVVQPLCVIGKGWPRVTQAWLASENRFITQSQTRYDSHGNPVSIINQGVERRIIYDADGLFPIEEHLTATGGRDLVWQASYDRVLGAITGLTDPNGHRIAISHDNLGRYTGSAVDGRPRHQIVEYDWTPPYPKTTVWSFEGPLADVAAKPADWSPTNHWRQAVEVANGKGNVRYRAVRLASDQWIISDYRERDPNARVVFAGRPVYASQLELAARPTDIVGDRLVYDPLGRVIIQELPTGSRRTFSYVAFERTMQEADLAPVHSVLDGQGRAILTERSLDDGTHEVVQARYDAAGRLTLMSLAGGAVTRSFTYDTLGRLTQSQDPDLGTRTLTWDDGNRLLDEVNAVGQATHYSYDALGRLVTRDAGAVYHYHYDEARPRAERVANLAGQLAWVEEPTGGEDLSYDELGRVVLTRRRIDDRVSEAATAYASSGAMLSRSYEDGFVARYQYDPAGRLVGIDDLWQVLLQDASGRVTHERAHNGVDTRYTRDVLGLASTVTVRDVSGAAIYDVEAKRNAATAITSVTDLDGAGLDHDALFGYDGFARLTSASVGTGGGAFTFNYSYDVLHNMTSRTMTTGPRSLGQFFGTYRYGEAGHAPRQLTSIVNATAQVTHTFNYDSAGRQIAEGNLSMTYDPADRLLRVDGLSGGSVVHAYGQDGARVKTVAPDGSVSYFFGDGTAEHRGAREHDVSIGDRVVARVTMAPPSAVSAARVALATASLGIATTLGPWGLAFVALAFALFGVRPMRRRARAAGMLGLLLAGSCAPPGTGADRAALSTAPRATFLHQGFGAGPAVFTNAAGQLLEERRFEPFGAPIDARILSGAGYTVGDPDLIARDLNALNKRTDAATGWSDHGARWMAPETGRWLTPDPPVKGPSATFMGAPWALHPYQYVNQNPVAYWDPDGQSPDATATIDVWAALTAAGGRIVSGVATVLGAPAVMTGATLGLGAYAQYKAGPISESGYCDVEWGCLNDFSDLPMQASQATQTQAPAKDRLALIRARAQASTRSVAEPRSTERTVLLHRGVPQGHPGYDYARLGIAYPRGGDATPEEHNAGNTESIYTSWTTRRSVAESAALDSHFGTDGAGVVLSARIPMSRLVKSPDRQDEGEVLVIGPVTGAATRDVPEGLSRSREED